MPYHEMNFLVVALRYYADMSISRIACRPSAIKAEGPKHLTQFAQEITGSTGETCALTAF